MNRKIKKEQLLIGVLLGILLLVIAIPIPKGTQTKEEVTEIQETPRQKEQDVEKQLKEILQKISGVGRVEVFLTYEDKGRLVVEKDESESEEIIAETDSNGGTRTTNTKRGERETVYDSGESPYIIQEISPTVKGVLVVAEGAGNTGIKKQIRETIEALFGLEAHKISIMKMEVSR